MSNYLDKITVGSTTYDIKDSNAYVLPSTGIPSSDLAAGVIPIVPTAYDTAAQALGTASAGTSTSWARGDHIHPMPSASDVGAVIAPASASSDNVLAYNGSAWVADKRMVILSYGHSTWAEFLSAYHANAVIYCRASSNANPGSGSQTRMAFMAYVNNADNPTNVEFQYYRSVNSHSVTQQGDQVYVYKLDKTAGWTVTVRESYTKINVSTGLASSYSNSALTITNPAAVPTGGTTGQALVKTSNSNYALAWQTIDVGHSIPSGGLNGQVLAKSSDDDYEVAWTTLSDSGSLPSGGSEDQVLRKNSSTDNDASWSDDRVFKVNFSGSSNPNSSDKTAEEIWNVSKPTNYVNKNVIVGRWEDNEYYLSKAIKTSSITYSATFICVREVTNRSASFDKILVSTNTSTGVTSVSRIYSTLNIPQIPPYYEFCYTYNQSTQQYTYNNSLTSGDIFTYLWGTEKVRGSRLVIVYPDTFGTDDLYLIAQCTSTWFTYEEVDNNSVAMGHAKFSVCKEGNGSSQAPKIIGFDMVCNLDEGADPIVTEIFEEEVGGGGLPSVTSADNGKVLRVVNGVWAAAQLSSANGVIF